MDVFVSEIYSLKSTDNWALLFIIFLNIFLMILWEYYIIHSIPLISWFFHMHHSVLNLLPQKKINNNKTILPTPLGMSCSSSSTMHVPFRSSITPHTFTGCSGFGSCGVSRSTLSPRQLYLQRLMAMSHLVWFDSSPLASARSSLSYTLLLSWVMEILRPCFCRVSPFMHSRRS